MAFETERVPQNGTKAAVAYWARRTRQELREAQRLLAQGYLGSAAQVATDAAGAAGEFESAVHAIADERDEGYVTTAGA